MSNQQETGFQIAPTVIVQEYLLPGEEVVWAGQPDSEQYARKNLGCWLAALIVVSLLVLLLFLFGVVGFMFFVAPVLVAIAIPSYLSHKRQEAQDRVYAVTTQRLLLISLYGFTSERSYQLSTITKVEVVIDGNTIGNIFFAWDVHITEGSYTVTNIGFEKIPQVGQVAAQLYQQLYGDPS